MPPEGSQFKVNEDPQGKIVSLSWGRDRVAVPWLGYACGACEYCASGWETLCEKQLNTGYFLDGGHAEYSKAFAKYVGHVPEGVHPFEAAPLTCAGVTTYKAVKVSGMRPSDLVHLPRATTPGN